MHWLKLLKFMALCSYSTLGTAELRGYDWDGVFPRAEWHGWCDLYGDPYSVLFDVGSSSVAGGWVDVTTLASLEIFADITGSDPAAVGNILVQFQGAITLDNALLWNTPSDLQFSADFAADSIVRTLGRLDVLSWNYVRMLSVKNMGSHAASVRLMCHDGVRPVELL